MKHTPSPNFNARADGTKIAFVIVHYTGMLDAQTALTRMLDPQSEVSAHVMIDEAGEIYRLVADEHRAWHAGQSFWQGQTDLNSLSIGIELVNKGHEFGYTPFPAPQIEALKTEVAALMKKHALPAGCLWGHSDIAPLRKEDPGELFPWEDLAAEGMGLWPHPTSTDEGAWDEEEITRLLQKVGYDTRTPDVLAASRTAFLRHFHTEQLTEGFSDDSAARLRALAKLIA